MNFYSFCNILNENQGATMPGQDVSSLPSKISLGGQAAGMRQDIGEMGMSGWTGLQRIYEALQILAKSNPQKFMSVISTMKTAIDKEHPDVADLLKPAAAKVVSGMK